MSRPAALSEIADRALAWDELEREPARFTNRPGASRQLRHQAVFRRPSRSAIRVELGSVRRLPIGFDEEED